MEVVLGSIRAVLCNTESPASSFETYHSGLIGELLR